MRLLYHVPFPVIGGAETQLEYLFKNMPGEKPMVTYEYDEVLPWLKKVGVQYRKVQGVIGLAQAIEQFRPDIFQFYHSHTAYGALKRIKRREFKVVEILHNRLGFPGDATSYGKDCTDMVVGVSPDALKYFHTHMPDVPGVVIPNGVDTTIFKPSKTPRQKNVGGFSGRLEEGPGKGVPTLYEVFKGLPDIKLELVGSNSGRYQETENISIYPYTKDIIKYYERWGFFVSASPAEGFGLSIAEALACGIPSVIWDCGGVCHWIENGKHAFLVKSVEEMREKIQLIIDGNHNLKPETLDLSASKMAQSYLELYNSLLGKTAPIQVEVSSQPVDRMAVVEKSWYGVRRALEPITDMYSDPSLNTIPLMRKHRPKVIVLGCYQPHWENILLEAKKLGIKVVCTWHASFILNEFDHVNRVWMKAMIDAYKKGLIHRIATPHDGLALTLNKFGIKTDFLPNIVNDLPPVPKLPGINIGILGSGQAWKNMECQIIAASFIPDAKIHIQNLKHPEIIDALGLRPRIVQHGHISSDEEYYKLVGGMTVNMVVSLSEVYSYFAAESLLLKTPVLTTPITPIFHEAPPVLQECCTTPYFEDPVAIYEKLKTLVDVRDKIADTGQTYMRDLNRKMKIYVEDKIKEW